MEIPERVKGKIESIKNDREKGASELVFEVIEAFRIFIDEVENKNEKIDELVEIISKVRPSMFPLANHAKRLRNLLYNTEDRTEALKILSLYTAEIKERNIKIIENARFLKNSTIITCSYSSIVEGFLKKFINDLKNVFVCESRVRVGHISYGKKYLTIQSPKISIISDDEMKKLSGMDCGILGADGITSDGYVINGKPSLKLCLRLHNLQKPVWFLTGLDKFGEKMEKLEEGFDIIPENLIKGFITEKGIFNFKEFCDTASSIYR